VRNLARAVDIVIAALALVVTAPVAATITLAIRLEGGGPAIYRQRRVGRGGREFDLYKFRTMVSGSDPVGIGTAVAADDPRVTRVGRLLRKLSLDELPNLVNVLRGDMAIVGPRPTIPAQVELYTPRQRRRLEVRPGLTGWAQVSGRTAIDWSERIELDVWYVENRSPVLDARILARTVRLLLTGQGIGGDTPSSRVPPEWRK
jgi:lipopolysaccharide/colanic/teichoic acid biosynthesis glycosyltransferase